MSDESTNSDTTAKKSRLGAIMLGLVLALAGAGGGFFAAYSGLIPMGGSAKASKPDTTSSAPAFAFVPIDPLIVSIAGQSSNRHLRFQAQLEVDPEDAATVQASIPRVVDVLNGYLRAVDVAELEDPASLARRRAQMFRRVQIIVGDDLVNDLLIMEFVLS